MLKSPQNRLNSIIEVFEDWGVRKEKEFHYLRERGRLFDVLEDLLANISDDVLAVEFSAQRIGLLSRETDDSETVYAELVEFLKKLKTLLEEDELDHDSE